MTELCWWTHVYAALATTATLGFIVAIYMLRIGLLP